MTGSREPVLGGRLAVVVGASQGIGEAIAIAFGEAGARLVLLGRSADRLASAKSAVHAAGADAEVIEVDVREVSSVHSAFAEILRDVGEPTIVVNSAGVPYTKEALEVSEREWDDVMDVHLKGTFFVCQTAATYMGQLGYGKVINLSSTWAFSTDIGKSVYAVAKAGVSHLTSALAVEWAHLGIRVNAIAPCTTATVSRADAIADPKRGASLVAHIPMARVAEPKDIVGAAVFLAGEDSDFITGHTLMVDGGWRARS